MKSTNVYDIFEDLKISLIKNYRGFPEKVYQIEDIALQQCRMAEEDHLEDRRIFMHVGCSNNKPMTICTCRALTTLAKENIIGLLCHEIGHVLSLELPELVIFEKLDLDKKTYWGTKIDDEILADLTVELMFGVRIYYDKNKVQYVVVK